MLQTVSLELSRNLALKVLSSGKKGESEAFVEIQSNHIPR